MRARLAVGADQRWSALPGDVAGGHVVDQAEADLATAGQLDIDLRQQLRVEQGAFEAGRLKRKARARSQASTTVSSNTISGPESFINAGQRLACPDEGYDGSANWIVYSRFWLPFISNSSTQFIPVYLCTEPLRVVEIHAGYTAEYLYHC